MTLLHSLTYKRHTKMPQSSVLSHIPSRHYNNHLVNLKMNALIALLVLATAAHAQFSQQAPNSYGAPVVQPPRPQPPRPQPPRPQPAYTPQPQVSTDRRSEGQSESHDHAGLDWLLESVPGQPGTDYPIYTQEDLNGASFDCNGQVEGGYYADTAFQCQAFHVCVPDAFGGLSAGSFLCPNGTIFNQEYFICDWWFNFDCSQAQGLYGRNAEVAAEREAASLAAASNVRNTFVPANNNNNNNFRTSNNNNNQAIYSNGPAVAPVSSYSQGK